MAEKPIFPGVIANAGASLSNASGTTKQTLYTAAVGLRVDQIRVCNTDTTAVLLVFSLGLSGTDYPLGEVLIPAGAGTDGSTQWVDALAMLNNDRSMFLESDAVLKVNAKAAVTNGKTVSVTLFGGDY